MKHTILFLAANPSSTDRLALDREARAIQVELERSGFRGRFELVTRWAVEPLDLLRELRRLRPAVVHFSGHGSQDEAEHGLIFQGAEGGARIVSTEALEEAFGAAGSSVKLVVLNACYSDARAAALLAHVDCVVGVEAVHGDAARSFAIGLYGGLGEQESVAAAYRQGCAAVSLEGQHGMVSSRLRVRADVDAEKLVLAAGPSVAPSEPPTRTGPSKMEGAHGPRDHRAGARGAARARAPARREVFIGREAELSRLQSAFGISGDGRDVSAAIGGGSELARVRAAPDGAGRVVVQGMAGVGKTYLAQELYARAPERFGSYQHVVLDPERPGSASSWVTWLGERAGIEASLDEAASVEVLRARRTLVHVDNVDSHLAAELAAELARLLVEVPLLVTGRYAELGTAAGAGWTRIELLPLAPAAALDLLHAELEGSSMAATADELRGLIHQVAGLPLALHLAAGYLRRGVTVERFLARLRDKGLALGPRDPADHLLAGRARGVLSTSFAISRELMLAEAGVSVEDWGAALAALGWAPRAGFGRSLGTALTGLDEASGAFEDFIDAAVTLSLVRRLRPEERAAAAWAVHPMLGEFLRGPSERAEIDARIGRWVAAQADEAPEARAARWGELAAEAPSIGEWLGAATDATVRELLPRAARFATSRGPIRPWLSAARRIVRSGVSRDVLWASCQLAARAGELDSLLETATDLARHAGETDARLDRARAMGQIADVLSVRGELDEALRIRREEVLPIVEQLGEARERALTQGGIADVLFARGELDGALQIYREEQLPVFERLGDVQLRAFALSQIATILFARGEFDEVLRLWREEVLPVHERLGDARSCALTWGFIADVLLARGELDEALRICREEELPVYEELGDVRSRAGALGRIADMLFARGELEEALRIRREEELPVYERLGDVRSRAITLGRIADVLFARGELEEALRIRREEQLPVYERLGDVRSRAITLGKIADVYTARGQVDLALRIRREEELPVYERLGDVRARAITVEKIARLLLARGEVAEALRLHGEAKPPVDERASVLEYPAVLEQRHGDAWTHVYPLDPFGLLKQQHPVARLAADGPGLFVWIRSRIWRVLSRLASWARLLPWLRRGPRGPSSRRRMR